MSKVENSYWKVIWFILVVTMKFLLLLVFAFTTGIEMLMAVTNEILKDILKIN
jgi:hypothetical protein